MNRFMQRAALLLFVMVPVGACDTFGSDNSDFLREQLTRAEQRWSTNGSSNYTLVVTRRCDCGIEPLQVSLEIVDDEIVSGTYTDLAEPVDESDLGQYATVLDLFALARDAINQRVPVVLLEYNQEFGYIDDLVINYDRTRVDDDFLYVVDDYIPAS